MKKGMKKINNREKKIWGKIIVLLTIFLFGAGILKTSFAASTFKNWLDYKDQLTGEGLSNHYNANVDWYRLEQVIGNPENPDQISALRFSTQLIASLYSSPAASGVYYAYDLFRNFGASPAYAQQGIGFTGLQPILSIWKAFRNVTYIFFTIIFILMGLMIMFRVKISQQAVMTIENAIPKIIGALILVTFSYAIAGLLIDFMYVLIALGIMLLKASGLNFPLTTEETINSGFFTLVPPFAMGALRVSILGGIVGGVLGALGGALVGSPIPVVGNIIGGLAGGLGGVSIGVALVLLIFGIISLFLFIKLFFALVKSYIKIILAIILGPLQIMAGAIPGMGIKGFGAWLKGLFTEILVFPAVIIVAMVGYFIMAHTMGGGQLWTAPMIGLPTSTGATITQAVNSNFITAIIGIGFLFVLASIPDMIRASFGQKASPFESAIGKSFAPVGAIAGLGANLRAQDTSLELKKQEELARTGRGTVDSKVRVEKAFWDMMSNVTKGKVRT